MLGGFRTDTSSCFSVPVFLEACFGFAKAKNGDRFPSTCHVCVFIGDPVVNIIWVGISVHPPSFEGSTLMAVSGRWLGLVVWSRIGNYVPHIHSL